MESLLIPVLSNMAPAPLKPYTLKDLARLYDTSSKVMRGWLRTAQLLVDRVGYYYNINQVDNIFKHLGHPETDTNQ